MEEYLKVIEETLFHVTRIPNKAAGDFGLALGTSVFSIVNAVTKFGSKQLKLIAIRIIIECCTYLQAADDKVYAMFSKGKSLDKMGLKSSELRAELDKRFKGFNETYSAACAGLHPTKLIMNEFELKDSYVGYKDYEYDAYEDEFYVIDFDLEAVICIFLLLRSEFIHRYVPEYEVGYIKELKFFDIEDFQ
jgi:hypothetical protein